MTTSQPPHRNRGLSTHLTRRQAIASLVGAVAAGRAVGHAQTPVATPAPARVPVVRVGVQRIPEHRDPLRAATIEEQWLTTLEFDAPLRQGADARIIGGLTTPSAFSREGRTLTLQLRPDARFPNGSLVNATDVRYSLERLRNAPEIRPYAWRLERVERIADVDERTIRIELERPDASLLATLSQPLCGVMSLQSADTIAGRGSGPFELMESSREGATWVRSEWFWEVGRPPVDRIEVIPIPDDTWRTTALVTGEIDVLPGVPLLDIEALQQDPSVYLVGGPSNRTCLLQVNCHSLHLADPRVRRLLSQAIDRARLVASATSGQAVPTSLLLAGTAWAADDIEEEPLMPNGDVRDGLRAAGIPSDLRLSLVTDNTDATLANTAVVLQEQLANCGIALQVDLLDGRALQDALLFREYDLIATYAAPWRDPHEFVRPLLAEDGSGNAFRYANAAVDAMITGAAGADDAAMRRARYRRLEQEVQDDVPVIVLFRPHYFDAIATRLAGYRLLPPVTSRGLLSVSPFVPPAS